MIEIESGCVTMDGSVVVDVELDPLNDIAYEGGTSSSSFLMIFHPNNYFSFFFFLRSSRKWRQEMSDKLFGKSRNTLHSSFSLFLLLGLGEALGDLAQLTEAFLQVGVALQVRVLHQTRRQIGRQRHLTKL